MHREAPIGDHILIGNCRSAALVSSRGSIDWYCLPEFHSPAVFAALLDSENGGHFTIQPLNPFRSSQNYIPGTNVGELNFENDEGRARLTDCYVAIAEKEKQASLFPDHEVLRVVEGLEGSVAFRFEYRPRTNYGKKPAALRKSDGQGIIFDFREVICVFRSTLPDLQLDADGEGVTGTFLLKPGERVIFSLSCSTQYPAVLPELPHTALRRLEQTIAFWRHWAGICRYEGPFKDQVLRSALTLKLLTHAPSGAIIAAPTTSLPETPGGVRNWDYRFCWLRDASFTVRALIKLGYYNEAHAYMSWILHATRLTRPRLQVVYTVFGNAKINEKQCYWLSGHLGSRPVRVGNNATYQLQLDVYGEVLDAVAAYSEIVGEFDRGTRQFIIGLGKTICRHWTDADNGIWEIRSSPRQHTHSKVMAWVGLDRLIGLCDKYQWQDAPRQRFEDFRARIRHSVEQSGFNEVLNSYVRDFDGRSLDAVLLTFSLVEYCDALSPRMQGTIQQIKNNLSAHNFIYRYKDVNDGLPGKEGAFLVASFWLIENLAKTGKTREAEELFLETVRHAPDHGLMAEEIDPGSKQWLGNYPQGFSHIGLINAALTISEQQAKQLQP